MPGRARSPKARPSAIVCSGLVEMCVAMNEEWSDALFVANADARFRSNFANAGKFGPWETLFPAIEQFHSIFAGDGEKQLKIFAICESRKQRWLGG